MLVVAVVGYYERTLRAVFVNSGYLSNWLVDTATQRKLDAASLCFDFIGLGDDHRLGPHNCSPKCTGQPR